MKWLLPLLALATLLPQRGSAETTLGTVINAVPYTIAKPGVYRLTKDLVYTPATGVAINIGANDVVIDLNAHEILALSGTGTTGIYCPTSNRAVIKNGTIRDFQAGVILLSSGARVSDLLVIGSAISGITVVGNNVQILRNRVCDTGGTTGGAHPFGITLSGTDGAIYDNDVQNIVVTDANGRSASGIRIQSCANAVVSDNRVLDVEPAIPASGGASTGIATATSSGLVLLGNTVVDTQTGFDLSGGASGKYGDNITSNISGTDYLLTSGSTSSGMTVSGTND